VLVNGVWSKDFHPLQNSDEKGRFKRVTSSFRNWITPDGSPGPDGQKASAAEAGRYHLYVALICPWACRTLMARKLKELESVISVTVVEPFLSDQCWRFGDFPGAQNEPFYGFEYTHQLYTLSDADFTGQVTVPILWDKKESCIVNNESADILRILNSGFTNFANNDIDLYPEVHCYEIDALNRYFYENLNNGVYQAGFAETQIAYNEAYDKVFNALDFLEEKIKYRRFLVGDHLSEADIRVFVTLVRFDIAYYGLFKTNKKQISDYPHIYQYMKNIYNLDGIAETVNFEHIKQGYYSIKALNPMGLVPTGPQNRLLLNEV
jgi:glutathionyl-hydroquinone reductase